MEDEKIYQSKSNNHIQSKVKVSKKDSIPTQHGYSVKLEISGIIAFLMEMTLIPNKLRSSFLSPFQPYLVGLAEKKSMQTRLLQNEKLRSVYEKEGSFGFRNRF